MNDRDLLAAEYALGLLEGEQLLEARGLVGSDPEFARMVDEWHERLAPLFDEIGEEAPGEEIWSRIRSSIEAGETSMPNVAELKRSVSVWKGVSVAASAIAASLAVVVAYDAAREPAPFERPAADIMVAALMSDEKVMMVSAAWRPEDRSLTVMPGAMQDAPGQDHELWVIPADGKPRSLGLVRAVGGKMAVAPAMAPHLAGTKVTLALSVEPAGGSPSGLPTGPVVASGALQKV